MMNFIITIIIILMNDLWELLRVIWDLHIYVRLYGVEIKRTLVQ